MEDLAWQFPAEPVERAAVRFCEAVARWRGKPELETVSFHLLIFNFLSPSRGRIWVLIFFSNSIFFPWGSHANEVSFDLSWFLSNSIYVFMLLPICVKYPPCFTDVI